MQQADQQSKAHHSVSSNLPVFVRVVVCNFPSWKFTQCVVKSLHNLCKYLHLSQCVIVHSQKKQFTVKKCMKRQLTDLLSFRVDLFIKRKTEGSSVSVKTSPFVESCSHLSVRLCVCQWLSAAQEEITELFPQVSHPSFAWGKSISKHFSSSSPLKPASDDCFCRCSDFLSFCCYSSLSFLPNTVNH